MFIYSYVPNELSVQSNNNKTILKGNVSRTLYYIDKETFYPIKMRGESYSTDNPKQKFFIDQRYYDIQFNLIINENIEFNTSHESIVGFEIREMKPE